MNAMPISGAIEVDNYESERDNPFHQRRGNSETFPSPTDDLVHYIPVIYFQLFNLNPYEIFKCYPQNLWSFAF